jgi:hypothetical protein
MNRQQMSANATHVNHSTKYDTRSFRLKSVCAIKSYKEGRGHAPSAGANGTAIRTPTPLHVVRYTLEMDDVSYREGSVCIYRHLPLYETHW